MFGFLYKRPVSNVRLLPIKSYSSSSSKKKTLLLPLKDNQKSFTVSYLMDSCGLSLENAITASKKVHFETPHKPDSVLRLLRNHEFTDAQITKFVRIRPPVLVADPEKTLLPKLQFFRSIGLSATVLPIVISSNPTLVVVSLDKHLIPSYKFIKSVVQVNEKVAMALKNWPKIMQEKAEKTIAPNVSVLRDHGVPAPHISFWLTRNGSSLIVKCDKFEKCVKEVIEMGFNPSTMAFIYAVQVTAVMTESTWNRKMEVYRKWGWSEAEFRVAFRSNPILMNLSEEKITRGMEFLVNKMGFESATLAKNPTVLCYSLEKRTIPRCTVMKLLLLKGLISKDLSLGTYLNLTEKAFLDRFVTKYDKDASELLGVYQGKGGFLS